MSITYIHKNLFRLKLKIIKKLNKLLIHPLQTL